MLTPFIDPIYSFENCEGLVRVLQPRSRRLSSRLTESILTKQSRGVGNADCICTASHPGAGSSSTTCSAAPTNNTPPTLRDLQARRVRIQKHYRYEKRNANQLVAIRRVSDCDR